MSLVIILIAIAVALLFIAICFTLAEAATRRAGLANNAAKATFRDSYTKTLAQVFGGAAVVLAFAWTIIKDSKTLEQSAVRAANQQFIEAAKLMADEKIEARAAGNYSYEKLVAAYPEYYDPVINTLLAFILQQRPKSEDFERGARPALVTEDVQAAIYVIGKIPLRGGYGPFRLVDYYLSGANFSGLESFKGADFSGARLFHAKFVYADLGGAKFDGARFEDWGAYGWANHSWDQRMKDARNPNDTWWEWESFRYIAFFDHAKLGGATFKGMSVSGASFKWAELARADFKDSDISRADFTNAEGLLDAKFDGACFGRDEEGKPSAKPTGLPESIMRNLRTC